jgi:hypothetical protein
MKYNFHGTFEKHPRLYFHDDGGEEGTLDITIPYTELMRKVLWFAESDLFIEDRPDILELMTELKDALTKRVKDYERLKELESHMQPVLGHTKYNVRANYEF